MSYKLFSLLLFFGISKQLCPKKSIYHYDVILNDEILKKKFNSFPKLKKFEFKIRNVESQFLGLDSSFGIAIFYQGVYYLQCLSINLINDRNDMFFVYVADPKYLIFKPCSSSSIKISPNIQKFYLNPPNANLNIFVLENYYISAMMSLFELHNMDNSINNFYEQESHCEATEELIFTKLDIIKVPFNIFIDRSQFVEFIEASKYDSTFDHMIWTIEQRIDQQSRLNSNGFFFDCTKYYCLLQPETKKFYFLKVSLLFRILLKPSEDNNFFFTQIEFVSLFHFFKEVGFSSAASKQLSTISNNYFERIVLENSDFEEEYVVKTSMWSETKYSKIFILVIKLLVSTIKISKKDARKEIDSLFGDLGSSYSIHDSYFILQKFVINKGVSLKSMLSIVGDVPSPEALDKIKWEQLKQRKLEAKRLSDVKGESNSSKTLAVVYISVITAFGIIGGVVFWMYIWQS